MSNYCNNGHYAEDVTICSCGCEELLCDDCISEHMKKEACRDIDDYEDEDDIVDWKEFCCPECEELGDIVYNKVTKEYYCTECEVKYTVDYDISQLVCESCHEPLELDEEGGILFEEECGKLYHNKCYGYEFWGRGANTRYKEYCNEDEY